MELRVGDGAWRQEGPMERLLERGEASLQRHMPKAVSGKPGPPGIEEPGGRRDRANSLLLGRLVMTSQLALYMYACPSIHTLH